MLSYARVRSFVEDETGAVQGVQISDVLDETSTATLLAKVTVNSTGPWSDLVLRLCVTTNRRRWSVPPKAFTLSSMLRAFRFSMPSS